MGILLAILSTMCRQAITGTKMLLVLSKVALLRVALSIKLAFLYVASFVTARGAFLAAIWVAFEAGLSAISFLVVAPLSSSLISSVLPTNDSFVQGLYYLAWDEGLCLSTLWGYVVVYAGNVLAAHRVVNLLAEALSYRIMIFDGHKTISLGMLSGR